MPEEVMDSLWDADELDLSSDQRTLLPQVREWVFRTHADKTSQMGFRWTSKEDPSIARQIFIEFKLLKKASDALRILDCVRQSAREHGLGVLPSIPIAVSRRQPKNPIAVDLAENLRLYRELKRGLEHWLGLLSKKGTIPIECVVLSGILHGGLLSGDWVATLLRSLQSIERSDHEYSVEMRLPWRGQPDMEARRWYPDPLTAALLLRLDQNSVQVLREEGGAEIGDKQMLPQLWRRMRKALPENIRNDVKSLAQIIRIATVVAHLEMPAVLVSYATRKVVSHSLKPEVIDRLRRKRPSSLEIRNATPLRPMAHQMRLVFQDPKDESEPEWLRNLRRAFRESGTNRRGLANKLKQILPLVESSKRKPEGYVTGFAYALTKEGSRAKHKLQPNTIGAYVFTVARRLLGILKDPDLDSLSVDDLTSAYGRVLDDALDEGSGAGLRRNVARALREFHSYLHNHHDVPDVDDAEVFGLASGLASVDATVITEGEFRTAQNYIRNTSEFSWDRDLREIAALVLMLAYRCGMRRMEILGLDTNSFLDFDRPELLIRPSAYRKLKTKSSTRRMPLWCLLDANELRRLRVWVTHRRRENLLSSGGECFLFSLPNGSGDPVAEYVVIPVIHTALQKASGTQDGEVHLHHCRHSFCTRILLRLMLADLPSAPDLPPWVKREAGTVEDRKILRESLYGNQYPTRKHAFAAASLMGHSSPDISLEHYGHSLDILLRTYLQSSKIFRPAYKELVAASGKSRKPAARLLRQSPWTIAAQLAKKRERECRKPSEPPAEVLREAIRPGDFLTRLTDFLRRLECDGKNLTSLASACRFSDREAWAICRRAHWLRDRRSKYGAKGFVHRMEVRNGKRLYCPEKPAHASSDEVIRKLSAQLDSLPLEKHLLMFRAVSSYARNFRRNVPQAIFKDPENPRRAEQYIAFLESLGVKKKNQRFIVFDSDHCGDGQRSKWRNAWSKALKVESSKIEIGKLPSGKSKQSAKWIGIEPSFGWLKTQTAHDGMCRDEFRFVMLMHYLAPLGEQ